MKKSSFSAALLLIGLTVSGCPVYDDDDVGCYEDIDCQNGYVCDASTGACLRGTDSSQACNEPNDCGTNETCSRAGSCVIGDCSFASVGCVRGFECSPESGRWECVEKGSSNASGGAPSSPPSDTGGAPDSPSAAGASN